MPSRTVFPTAAAIGFAAMLLGLVAAGCGEEAIAADQFVGTWRYDATTTSVVQRFTQDPYSQPPVPHKTFAHGTGPEIIDLSVSPLEKMRGTTCDFTFDVAGPVARARPGQVCQLNALDTLTIDTDEAGKPLWTFSLTSATTAQELVTATMHLVHPETSAGPATEETASWSLVATLTRISKD
jgi:hypothetical protein